MSHRFHRDFPDGGGAFTGRRVGQLMTPRAGAAIGMRLRGGRFRGGFDTPELASSRLYPLGVEGDMFPDTCWTQLSAATLNGDPAGRAALDELCRNYWEPVRVYIIQRGWPPQDAPDLAQAFFLRLMERGIHHGAERDKGRFRCFIQAVLNHFLLNERDRRRAAKRGGGVTHLDVEEETPAAAEVEAGAGFDREWALAIMRAAVRRTAAECREERGGELFQALKVYIGGSGEALPQEAAAARLGMSPAGFRGEIFTWRRRLRENLRAEVHRTVSAPHEADEEMSYIHQLLLVS